MNIPTIKIIKRKDILTEKVRRQSLAALKPPASLSEKEIEDRLSRTISATIAKWIAERRANNLLEETADARKTELLTRISET